MAPYQTLLQDDPQDSPRISGAFWHHCNLLSPRRARSEQHCTSHHWLSHNAMSRVNSFAMADNRHRYDNQRPFWLSFTLSPQLSTSRLSSHEVRTFYSSLNNSLIMFIASSNVNYSVYGFMDLVHQTFGSFEYDENLNLHRTLFSFQPVQKTSKKM